MQKADRMALYHLYEDRHTNSVGVSQNARGLFALVELFLLTAILVGVVFTVYVDAVILGNGLSESSITENLHNLFILGSSLAFIAGAVRFPEKRGYLAIVGTLFMGLFIRENDVWFDFIWQGFWQVPAAIALVIGSTVVWRNRETVTEPFFQHFDSRYFTFVYLGFLLLVVFSRLFGTSAIWEAVMQGAYTPGFKTVIQEGLELLGYTIVFYGSLMSLWNRFGDR